MIEDDAEAVLRSQHGDVHAFNRLVERYQAKVFAVCYRLLRDADAAEDASQEVFLSAFRGIRSYRGPSFVAWLLRIARNECYDQLRARRRQVTLDTTQEHSGGVTAVLAQPSAAPEERALRSELARMLEQELLALPAELRFVVVLRDVHGYSYAEIVAATGVSLGTIKSRLSRGRARLRATLRAAMVLPQARHIEVPLITERTARHREPQRAT